jgi:putative NIF3 family GTP cyclohydrolase 1 type 2
VFRAGGTSGHNRIAVWLTVQLERQETENMDAKIHHLLTVTAIVLSSVVGADAQAQRVTARELVAEIQKQVGVKWQKETVDTYKAGNPDTAVTGIAVTMMATMDVLQRASAKGLNFVITHEPTFYAHLDQPEGMPESDPVWAEKRAFIEKHGMVVWRFHDHWHMRKPDGIEAGMVRALGWEKFQKSDNQYLFVLPETTVKKLAEEVAKKLDSPVVRVVGEPEMKVTRVGFSPGAAGFPNETHALEREDVQVLLVGETREWETVEYAADAMTQGRKKALIVIGHIPSEQAGMDECARWLKGFVKDVPVEFVPAKQPFWTVSDKK